MADTETMDQRKSHRMAHSGRKATKKKAKSPHVQEMTAKQRNPKAFAIQSVNKAERRFRRTMDIKSKSYHVPIVDRTPVKPPPAIVAIVGPPKVGKTTLLRCLIKCFTKQNMSSISGPVTLVSGKKKRITFIECNNDINQMMDIAKIADLVLLLVDAKSGFEMETFEFLNICQVQGMPRIMGVLTHLDLFKQKKSLQKTKTILKKRYRTEIPRGEKMFYLSGILHGEYLKNEVHNLGRFISVMKFQLSNWRKSHPHILADRMEDITDPDLLSKDPDCNRTVCLYGFARGGALKKHSFYHIPGCGDYLIRHIHFLPDPCPLPEKKKKRSLNEKERLIYAPMCGVGGVVYDKDAVYIELKDSQSQNQKPKEEEEKPSDKFVSSLIATVKPIDEKMAASHVSLFYGAEPLAISDLKEMDANSLSNAEQESESEDEESKSSESDEEELGEDDIEEFEENSEKDDDEDDSEKEEDEDSDHEELNEDEDSDEEFQFEEGESDDDMLKAKQSILQPMSRKRKKVHFADEMVKYDSCSEKNNEEVCDKGKAAKKRKVLNEPDFLEGEEDALQMGHQKWKDDIVQKAANAFYRRQQETINLQKVVYGTKLQSEAAKNDSDPNNEIVGGLFFVPKKQPQKVSGIDDFDCTKFVSEVSRDWTKEEELETIKDCFVTGKWADDEDAENLLKDDEELFGDVEDLEAETSKEKDLDENNQTQEDAVENIAEEKTRQEKRMEKKRKLKEVFDAQFDDKEERSYHDDLKQEAEEQGDLNKKEFENLDDEIRVQYEGYRPGLYLRLEIQNVPCEFIKNFDSSYPVIVGALLSGEDKMGYLQVRIKNHRWYPKILKSRDPLIISLGWRRFQTIPLYYITDHNGRNRLLKYTPKHLHCVASFYGPITPQKTGFCAVQTVSEISSDFRIAAIGSVMEVNHTTDIVKKLKLIGTPFEIFRKTAFIQGMFHSAMEVAKYEGAAIKTVSGIRGQIKKALMKPAGLFRATFEDKILMSDIVFLRTWVKVEVPEFCASVCSLLLTPEEKMKWQGMKTLGRLRYEKGLHAPVNEDSLYIPIERKLRQVAPLVIPKTLQKELPFRDKIVHLPKKKNDPENKRVAVIREPHEREVAKAMSMLKTMYKMKMLKERKGMVKRSKAHRKEKHEVEAKQHKKLQEKKKRIYSRPKAKQKTD